jgi:hypothetical protein
MKSPNRIRLEALIEAGKADPSEVFAELSQMARELLDQAEPPLFPRDTWHEDHGDVLWFYVRPEIGHPEEAPFVGHHPDMGGTDRFGEPTMPDYVTHWTFLPSVLTIDGADVEMVTEQRAARERELRKRG